MDFTLHRGTVLLTPTPRIFVYIQESQCAEFLVKLLVLRFFFIFRKAITREAGIAR